MALLEKGADLHTKTSDGGPDGDVTGNFFKIKNRDLPDTCKILGIADGFGVAEDPEV
jgi:hypothetical protein